MKDRITVKELAKELGVHHSTISLGLGGSRRVSKPMQSRIRALARERGYSPNFVARSLRRSSTKTLGVIFPYATSPYYATLLDALYAETLKRGFHLEVCFHQWNAEEETVMLRTLAERQVEGLILLPASDSTYATLTDIAPLLGKTPISMLGYVEQDEIPSMVRGIVYTDMREGSRELGEFLLGMGHRHMALLSPNRPPPNRDTAIAWRSDRELGLREALEKCPEARLDVLLVEKSEVPDEKTVGAKDSTATQRSFELSRDVAEQFLRLSPRPTAAITTNEVGAHVLLDVLNREGCQVPRDVSVACYDGTFLSAYGPLSLTCVEQPLGQLASKLVDLVLHTRSGETPHKPEINIFRPTLVPRRSVARIT